MAQINLFLCLLGAAAATVLAPPTSGAMSSLAAARSVSYPHSPTGDLLATWMALCNEPNLPAMTTWLDGHLSDAGAKRKSAAERAKHAFELCHDNGGFTVDSIDAKGPSFSLLASGMKTHVWYNLQFIFDDAGRLDRFGEDPANPPESAMPKLLNDATIAREVDREVARLSDAGMFSGIVLVARGTKPVVAAAGGYSNRAAKSAFTADTQFTLGSIGKMFTAIAVGQLVDQKKMSFDDTVGHFLPDYPDEAVRERVTVGMLLSHTAGMGEFLDKRTPEMMRNGVLKAQDFLPLFENDKPQFPPGTSWAYSNAGIVLAGVIVERVSGENFPSYIRRHIFEVAGMRNSDPNNVPRAHDQLATPYTKEEGANDWSVAEADIGSPAGGAISTANDLIKFADALRRGLLVSSSTFDAICTANVLSPPGYSYGYGVEVEPLYGEPVAGHSGGFPGVSAEFHFLRSDPYVVVVLSNQDPPSASFVGSWALALVAEDAKRSTKSH